MHNTTDKETCPEQDTHTTTAKELYGCGTCGQRFTSDIARNNHRKATHAPLANPTGRSISCPINDMDTHSSKRKRSQEQPIVLEHESLEFNSPIDMLYVLYLQSVHTELTAELANQRKRFGAQCTHQSTIWAAKLSKHDFIMSHAWETIDASFIHSSSRVLMILAAERYISEHQ